MKLTTEEYSEYLIQSYSLLEAVKWHWFSYHFYVGPTQFAKSIMESCASIDRKAPAIGTTLFQELLSIGGLKKHEPHFEQLLQKLSEILVIERVVTSAWPEGTSFMHEPSATPGGPRPELLVTFGEERLVIEVKTPSLLEHIQQRSSNSTQLTYRGLPLSAIRQNVSDDGITLPRDNPVSDFLVDTNRKFSGFRDGRTASLLVIVWDDYIYEPISILTNQQSGLLTTNSYQRDDSGNARSYAHIDAVVAIRHLSYFTAGSREEPLIDRISAMDFGGDEALPNVLFSCSNVAAVPDFIFGRLRACPHDDPELKRFAEYNTQDFVFWLPHGGNR